MYSRILKMLLPAAAAAFEAACLSPTRPGVAAQDYLQFGALGFDLGLVDIFALCEQINVGYPRLANDEQETLLCGHRSERLFDRLQDGVLIHDAVARGSEHRHSGCVDAAQMDLSHNEKWGLVLVTNGAHTFEIPLHSFSNLKPWGFIR